MRMLNTEWFRNPPSPLERTLRRPILYRETIRLFLVRFLPLWIAVGLVLELIEPMNVRGPYLFAFFFALVVELFWLRWWYERFWLPAHLRRINQIKNFLKIPYGRTDKNKLVSSIEESAKLATRGLVEIGYVGLPAWGWEIIFRTLYPILVKPPRPPYHELLIGFPNKTVEGDQMLWEIAHRRHSGGSLRTIEFSRSYRPAKAGLQDDIAQFIEKFGSKVEDVDLALPTLAEKPEVITSMIELYRNSPSPMSSLQKATLRREKATTDVLKRVRIPQAFFRAFLVLVQKNVQIREDRRHHEFLGDYPIRLMLLELAKKVGKSEKEFFQMSWHDIKTTASHH